MGSITDVPGIRVGHASDPDSVTGCTVIISETPATGAADLRGGGTSTRQIDSLLQHNTYGRINAILLTGGSAFGLDASSGVVRYLEEKKIGLDVGYGQVVPSVPTAVIFDLGIGDGSVRPDADMGYSACVNASSQAVAEGSVGVGTGATVGKLLGISHATKSGVGTMSHRINDSDVYVGVFVVVNAFGDVISNNTGEVIAGVRNSPDGVDFPGTVNLIKQGITQRADDPINTTLAVIATNAEFSKNELMRIAGIGQTGMARVVSPVHTVADGDVVFAISCGEEPSDANAVGVVAAELIEHSIMRAIETAESLGGIPDISQLNKRRVT